MPPSQRASSTATSRPVNSDEETMTTTGIQKKLDALREQLLELKAERSQLEAAPVPRAEALEKLHTWLETERTRFHRGFNVRPFLDAKSDSTRFHLVLPKLTDGVTEADLICSAVATLGADALETVLTERLDAELAKQPPGLPQAERVKRLAAIDAELVQLERGEEQLIRESETAGLEIDRRSDADVRVVLGLDAA